MEMLIKRIKEKYSSIIERKKEGFILDYIDLASIYHTIKYFCVSPQIRQEWLEKIYSLLFTGSDLRDAFSVLTKNYNDIKRILSIWKSLNDDMWVLILLLRLELEMVKELFLFKNLPFPEMDLHTLCKEMKDFSQIKENQKAFAFSVSQMQKNSPLPFKDIWFEAEVEQRVTLS